MQVGYSDRIPPYVAMDLRQWAHMILQMLQCWMLLNDFSPLVRPAAMKNSHKQTTKWMLNIKMPPASGELRPLTRDLPFAPRPQ